MNDETHLLPFIHPYQGTPFFILKQRSDPFASFEGNESGMAQEVHYLSDVTWLLNSLFKAVMLS